MGALLASIENVTRIIAQCRIYEALYQVDLHNQDTLANLENSLVSQYAVVLEYLSLASN
jgi:hypothetical protein